MARVLPCLPQRRRKNKNVMTWVVVLLMVVAICVLAVGLLKFNAPPPSTGKGTKDSLSSSLSSAAWSVAPWSQTWGGLVFFAMSFGKAFDTYGYYCVESAVRANPDLDAFLIVTNATSPVHLQRLSARARKKVVVRRVMDVEIANSQLFSYAHLRVMSLALDMLSHNYVKGIVYTDLDVLHLRPLAPYFASDFTVGVVTRNTGTYGALNAGLILYHGRRLAEARDFLDAAIAIYESPDLDYFYVEKVASGHSCCVQHVFEHALDLALGPSVDWKRSVALYEDVKANKTVVEKKWTRRRAAWKNTKNADSASLTHTFGGKRAAPACARGRLVADGKRFKLRMLGLRHFLPSPQTKPSVTCSRPVLDATALHYKGKWKALMPRDFTGLVNESTTAVIARYHDGISRDCQLGCCKCCIEVRNLTLRRGSCTRRPFFPGLSQKLPSE